MISTLRKLPIHHPLRVFIRMLRGGNTRRSALLELASPPNLFQPSGTTCPNRYPELFRYVREQISDGPNTRLLSYGCSTGEEVFSLRQYFPLANIRGVDINPHNIRLCQRRLIKVADTQMSFACARSGEHEPPAHYDVIFAMAVFRHGRLGQAPSRCDHLIQFARFEHTVAGIMKSLKPGGLFAIAHANFRFSDCRISESFDKVFALNFIGGSAPSPLYDANNCLINGALSDDGVFRKLSITGSDT